MGTDFYHTLVAKVDDDDSAVIVHEKPDAYGEEESDMGNRLACGVIEPS